MDSDLAVHPSPVLTGAVLKVEQVVARLQGLQTAISELQLSPVHPQHFRTSRADSTSRVLSSKERTSVKGGADYGQHRDEYKRSLLKDCKPEQRSKLRAGRNHRSPPPNHAHDVISEILLASQFAKQIATLVAETLREHPTDQPQEPKGRVCRDGKKKDISFPSKAQLQKTMSAKAPRTSKTFKAIFPSDTTAKISRPKGPPPKSNPNPSSKWRDHRPNSSPPGELSPRLPRHGLEKKRRTPRLLSSLESSFRDSGDADDELSFPKRASQVRGSAKPWKLPRGVPSCSPGRASAPRPSPVKPTPSSGSRRNLLPNQQLMMTPESNQRQTLTKRRNSVSSNPLASSISKVTFKREGATKTTPNSKREHRLVDTVPLKSTTTTMLEILKVKSPPRRTAPSPPRPVPTLRRLMPLEDNNMVVTDMVDRTRETAKDLRSKDSLHVENLTHAEALAPPKGSGAVEPCEKENAPVPSCAPAVMFLRSMSTAHSLSRTLSRKNSGGSLFRRAKGWMSSQAVRHGRGLELER